MFRLLRVYHCSVSNGSGVMCPLDLKVLGMTTKGFFYEARQQSRIKSAIVSKYFVAWASVILSAQDRRGNGDGKIAYIDLFSGPGKYDDGTPSTPFFILSKAIADDRLRSRLVTFFNDRDEAESLRDVIAQITGVETLMYHPEVQSFEVGQEVVDWLESVKLVPSLVFLDPWGYKGLSLDLVNAATKDWGCDTILFFNYNRVNMAVNNAVVEEHMDALFGVERSQELRQQVAGLNPDERELTIVENLCEVLGDGGRYVLPFRFKDDRGTRTSHHLFLVTKHPRGYGIMKEIMAKESSRSEQGVASFEYDPLDLRQVKQFPLLAELAPRPLDELAEILLEEFAGRTVRMIDIYDEHNVGRPYVASNYKKALLKLEEQGEISVPKHRKGSFGDNVVVAFPAR